MEVKPLQTEIFDKTAQVEELQTLLKIKTKELDSLQERKLCPFAIINYEKLKMYVMIEVKSLQTTNELQNAIEDNEVQLEEFQMQKERIRELEVTIYTRNETVRGN